MDKVRIIGAGPAGLAAAIVLRQHDVSVAVFEKHHDVGHRLNGQFQGLENWSADTDITGTLNGIGIDINFLCEPRYGGVVHALDMDPVNVSSEKPIFYLVRRGPMAGTLDTGLKEQALALGAEIQFQNSRDHLDGQAIIGTGPKGADMIAVGLTFETSTEDTTVVILNDDIAPKGYAYLLINQGYGTIGTVLYRDYRRSQECFAKMHDFFSRHMKIDIRNQKKFGGFGNFFLRGSAVRDGQLYIGESAGFQDCLWGFGMRYSILSGYLAAKSIIEGSNYDSLWKQELGPMLETSLVNRVLFEKCGHFGYRNLAKKLNSGNPRRYLMNLYNPTLIKKLIFPLARRIYTSRVRDEICICMNSSRR